MQFDFTWYENCLKSNKGFIGTGLEVDKIVILSDYSGENLKLVKCLKLFFPECEIEIISNRTEFFIEIPLSPGAVYRENNG